MHAFYIVDVFSESKYAGNQLGVVRHAADTPSDVMQLIARETNFAETTFILSDEARDGGYDVRIFTPAHVAPVLNLAEADFDTRFPIQEVSTGLPFLLVPLKGLNAVKRARVNLDLLKGFVAPLEAKMIFVFSPETYNTANQINARMFGDEFGVVQDPATGSANGCLAGYLVKNKYWGKSEIDVGVEQGYEIKRKSLLYLRANGEGDTIDVRVGGQVFLVARGELV